MLQRKEQLARLLQTYSGIYKFNFKHLFMRNIFIIVFISFLLPACLKDKDAKEGTIGHFINAQKVVELAIPNTTTSFTSIALNLVNKDTVITLLPVRLASSAPAESDLVITLDTTITSTYVTNHPELTHFKSSLGSVLTLNEVIIPKGKFESIPLKLKINSALFDPAAIYLIGFKIKAVNNPAYSVSANYHTQYYAFSAKNIYDGVYSLQFKNYHPSLNSGYTGTTVQVELRTTGADKVKIFFPDFDGYYCPAILSGNITAFGSQEPEYSIDPATKLVTVQNSFSGATTFYTMNPGFSSRYDPAEKKLYAKWGYNYVNGDFSAASSREWEQQFTYLSPR